MPVVERLAQAEPLEFSFGCGMSAGELQREIRAVYQEVRPEKVESGEVELLLRKYRGQEGLLLRRVQYHYGLVVASGRLWRRDDDAPTWKRVKASLRADGLLRWTSELGQEGDDMDVRMCAVDDWNTQAAGRKWAFAVFATDGGDALDPGSQRRSLLVAAAENDKAKRKWTMALKETNEFFAKLRHERKCQKEEEMDEAEAKRESERTAKLEAERREDAEKQAAIDTLRAAALSKLETSGSLSLEPPTSEEAVAKLRAELEAALDDALVATSRAADAEASGDVQAAHAAYRDAVAAFLEAKIRIKDMNAADRPEHQVLVLIDDGSEQCKKAADALRQRATRRPVQDDPNQGVVVLHDLTAVPLLDPPRAVPAAIEKLILDADDL